MKAKKSHIWKIILFLLIVGLVAATTYFYIQYRTEKANNPSNEVRQLVQTVSKLMELPNEVPTLATVTDKEKLAEQNFFRQAENGDKVLIYLQAGKAILYRPSIHKIIDVTSVNQNSADQAVAEQAADSKGEPTKPPVEPTAQPEEVVEKTEPLTVTLLNGTSTPGATQSIETTLAKNSENFVVVARSEAVGREYSNSVVVDLTGENKNEVQALARTLGVGVGTLPNSEIKPSTDLVVLVGADLVQ